MSKQGMPKPINGEITDEFAQLKSKGLFLEPLHYPLDKDKIPENGYEYLHLVRFEELAMFPELGNDDDSSNMMCFPEVPVIKSKATLRQWRRCEANLFSHLKMGLIKLKPSLIKAFPKKRYPDVTNSSDKDWCLFTLGSTACSKIYDDEFSERKSTLPYLSIVLHLKQKEIFIILEWMRDWFHKVGMSHDLCRWIFSLLACLFKPLTDECEELLEDFCDDIVEKKKTCEKSEINQLHLIMSILKIYFCVNIDKFGTAAYDFLTLPQLL